MQVHGWTGMGVWGLSGVTVGRQTGDSEGGGGAGMVGVVVWQAWWAQQAQQDWRCGGIVSMVGTDATIGLGHMKWGCNNCHSWSGDSMWQFT